MVPYWQRLSHQTYLGLRNQWLEVGYGVQYSLTSSSTKKVHVHSLGPTSSDRAVAVGQGIPTIRYHLHQYIGLWSLATLGLRSLNYELYIRSAFNLLPAVERK